MAKELNCIHNLGRCVMTSRPTNGLLTKKRNDSKAIHDVSIVYVNELNRHVQSLKSKNRLYIIIILQFYFHIIVLT